MFPASVLIGLQLPNDGGEMAATIV